MSSIKKVAGGFAATLAAGALTLGSLGADSPNANISHASDSAVSAAEELSKKGRDDDSPVTPPGTSQSR